jgi:hypothetical protein
MNEIIGSVVSYVCQFSIILFVLKEFGIIASPWAKPVLPETTAERGAPGGFDLGGLMQGLVSGLQQGQPGTGEKKKKRKPQIEEEASVAPKTGILEVE